MVLGILIVASLPLLSAQFCQVSQSPGTPASTTINVIRGSSVNLQWAYTMVRCRFEEQSIGYASGSGMVNLLVKANNGNMQVVGSLPVHFNGRISTVAASNTLVINNIQYNDSRYQFRSIVKAQDSLWGQRTITRTLLPNYILGVTGAPSFSSPPPNYVKVNEGETMQIVAMAEANPAPSVKFHWINETMQIVKYPINVHPFVYRTVFELKNISSYFCGKNLTTEFTNIKGSSGVVETFIDLNVQLNWSLALATNFVNDSCVLVKWTKKLTGECKIKYILNFIDWFNRLFHTTHGYNVGQYTFCSQGISQVKQVTLVVSYKSDSVSESVPLRKVGPTTAVRTTTTSMKNGTTTGTTAAQTTSTSIKTGTAAGSTLYKDTTVTDKSTEIFLPTSKGNTAHCDNSKPSAHQQSTQVLSSVAVMAALGSVIFILVVAVVCLLVWNCRLRNSKSFNIQETVASQKDRGDNKLDAVNDVTYMDLKARVEASNNYATLLDNEPIYDAANADLYVNTRRQAENFSENPIYQNC